MDPKEFRRNGQADVDVETDKLEETDRSEEPDLNSCKVVKNQNSNATTDQHKHNNNIGEDVTKSVVPKSSLVISNGAQSTRPDNISKTESPTSDQDTKICSNTEIPNLSNIINSSISSSGIHNQSHHESQTNSNFSVIPNGRSSLPQASSSYVDSIPSNIVNTSAVENISHAESDMRNNVDYIFGIEKCPPKVACTTETSLRDMETGKWDHSSSYTTESALNNIGGSIGSTSHGTCCFLRPNINGTRDVEVSSSTQKRGDPVVRRDSSSGNEGDSSDGEDYCIYTYKGNDDPDEPMNHRPTINPGLDEAQGIAGQPNSGRSSPEMDFLEMDFDPGPSCELDTGDSDLASINEDIQNLTLDNAESDPILLNDLSKVVLRQQPIAPEPGPPKPREQNVSNDIDRGNDAASSPGRGATCASPGSQCMPSTSADLRELSNLLVNIGVLGEPYGMWEATSLNRSIGCPSRETYSYHNTSGDVISPGDNRDTEAELWADGPSVTMPESSNFNVRKNNLSSTLYHRMMAKKLMLNKQTFNQSGDSNSESVICNLPGHGLSPVEKVMLWSVEEATLTQITQIGTSACGATSAINALLALDVPFSLEVLVKGVATRLRQPGTPLPKYLASRSWAGATHKDLIRGISLATNGAAVAKFFAFYPERNVSLSHWIHYWISRGAAPIATLNLQNCSTGSKIPDAWHHQMIFGVCQAGLYMTNPLECLHEQLVLHQLVSPSILLVRRSDVVAHWNPATDLTPLTKFDQHWRKLNVLGQVVNMIRETMSERKQTTNSSAGASHIRIPASYQAGITLVMRSDAPAADELMHTEQLPLL